MIGFQFLQQIVEILAVIVVLKMAQLMNDHMISENRIYFYQLGADRNLPF